MGQQPDDELKIYRRIEEAPRKHPGRKYVSSLLDSFDVSGPETNTDVSYILHCERVCWIFYSATRYIDYLHQSWP